MASGLPAEYMWEETKQLPGLILIIVSSDRSSYSDDGRVYIQRPLFEILSIHAFL